MPAGQASFGSFSVTRPQPLRPHTLSSAASRLVSPPGPGPPVRSRPHVGGPFVPALPGGLLPQPDRFGLPIPRREGGTVGALQRVGSAVSHPARMRLPAEAGGMKYEMDLRLFAILIAMQRRVYIMAGATEKVVILDDTIEEIELDPAEMEELDRLAEETLACGIAWEDLKAELGL